MRRSSGGVAVLVLAALAVLPAARAWADDDDGLVWHGADRCGSVEALRAQIELHLGRPLAARDALRATIEVVRAPIEGEVRATLQIVTRRGAASREVQGASCALVVDVVAFMLATVVTGEGELRPISGTVVSDSAVPWIVRPVPVPRSLDAPRPRLEVQAAVDGWSDAGTLPQLRLGIGGSLAVSYGRFRGEVGGVRWPPSWAPFTSESAGTSGVGLESVSVRGCWGVWRLWLCGGALVGTMRGLEGVAGASEARWIAAAFQTRWQRNLAGPLGIAGSVEGVINLERPFLPLSDGRIPHEPEVFGVRLGLSGVVTLW